jgi:hypothetical protein
MIQKKHFAFAFLGLALGPSFVFAQSITVSPTTGDGTNITVTDSNDNGDSVERIAVFDPSGSFIYAMESDQFPQDCGTGSPTNWGDATNWLQSYNNCGSGGLGGFTTGAFYFAYYNNTTASDCGDGGTNFAGCIAEGAVGACYDLNGSTDCPTPPPPMATSTLFKDSFTDGDGLFVFGIFLFLASVPFWDRLLTIRRVKYQDTV